MLRHAQVSHSFPVTASKRNPTCTKALVCTILRLSHTCLANPLTKIVLFRILLVLRYGGTYLDSDIILTRRIPSIDSFLIAHSWDCGEGECLSNCLLHFRWATFQRPNYPNKFQNKTYVITPIESSSFRRGHPFLQLALQKLSKDFEPTVWGHQVHQDDPRHF